jgi:catechol 2,3-dioxygenase-like lactoylglutathione lyase family enzyme
LSDRPRVSAVTPLLVVFDLARSVEFYCQKLGFVEPAVHGDPPFFALFNRDGFDLMLGATYEGAFSDDGAEIRGEWSQGDQTWPLVFRRA